MKRSVGISMAVLVVVAGFVGLAYSYFPQFLPGFEQQSHSVTGTVIHVYDGDSFRLQAAGQAFDVEMVGIDAPENGQPYGDHAGDYLAELVENRAVTVEVHGETDDGEVVGELFLNGVSINRLLLTDGFVWAKRGRWEDSTWVGLEQLARKQKFGLWRYNNLIPPWEFRDKPLDFKG